MCKVILRRTTTKEYVVVVGNVVNKPMGPSEVLALLIEVGTETEITLEVSPQESRQVLRTVGSVPKFGHDHHYYLGTKAKVLDGK